MWLRVAMSGLFLTLFVASADARRIENWSYERLFKEADVVVIAQAKGTVASDDRAADERWNANLIGQRTSFSVINALKGQVEKDSITVVHFKSKECVLMPNGPLLIKFRETGPTIEGGGSLKYQVQLSTPQYLLFLKRTDDGHFEPLSGQIDPALSVKEIYAPLPAVIGGND